MKAALADPAVKQRMNAAMQRKMGGESTPSMNEGMKLGTKLDICFFLLVGVGIYFALLMEYNVDLLDFVRTPTPKQRHPAERMFGRK